jgi:hypothetical protein
VSIACPRKGCGNPVSAGGVVCGPDFTLLAGMCRGKKSLGQPVADLIQATGGGVAYLCRLCLTYHNGNPPARAEQFAADVEQVLSALRADPRVGWRGMLRLADRWRPPFTHRAQWSQGLDQSEAFMSP